MNSHTTTGLWCIKLKTALQSHIPISYLSLSWLFEGHGQPAGVGAGHGYRPSGHSNSAVVVFLLVHQGPRFPAVHPVLLVIFAIPVITLHRTVPEAHARVRAGGNNQVGSQAHRVDRGWTQMTWQSGEAGRGIRTFQAGYCKACQTVYRFLASTWFLGLLLST